jgi:hypothetical protein
LRTLAQLARCSHKILRNLPTLVHNLRALLNPATAATILRNLPTLAQHVRAAAPSNSCSDFALW